MSNMATGGEKIKASILHRYRQRNKASKRYFDKAMKFLPVGDTRNVCFYKPYPTLCCAKIIWLHSVSTSHYLAGTIAISDKKRTCER
jgi:hypothetical protein